MDNKDMENKEKERKERTEDLLKLFKRGAEFTQQLLKENERLRYKLVQLKEENRALQKERQSPKARELSQQLESLRREIEELKKRYEEVEAENHQFATRYVEIEEENNNLANLYISSFQLHSTLDFNEVLQIIIEIIINLIGAEQFAILLIDKKTHTLKAMATEGIQPELIPRIRIGEGVIGKVAETGESYYVSNLQNHDTSSLQHPIVCIPLKIKNEVLGVIAIYKLLQQKKEFANVDFELFTLLAGHAATAIFSSKLYTESERKLSTIQGFINLLTK
jgi:nitrate/nitrite-specific signal transduction histidine kinase